MSEIIYNVTIKLNPGIEQDWIHWMETEHMPEVMLTGQFDQCRLFQLMEPQDEEGPTYVAQYSTDDLTRYQRYIDEFSSALREKGYARFGNQFIAFRSVLRELL